MIGTCAGQKMHLNFYATIGTIEERAIGLRRIFKHFLIHGTKRCVEFWMHFWYVLVYFPHFFGACSDFGVPIRKRCQKVPKSCSRWTQNEDMLEQKCASGPLQKKTKFWAAPETAQKRHVGGQGAQTVPKREHFGGIFGAFSGSGGKSENRCHSHAIAQFSRCQATPKSPIFDALWEAAQNIS